VDALIAQQRGATFVVTLDENAHPAWRKRQDLCRLIDVVTLRQKPKRVEVALANRLACSFVAVLQLRGR
jgi:hypothetical protein